MILDALLFLDVELNIKNWWALTLVFYRDINSYLRT